MPVTFGSELDSLYKYNDCLIFSKPVVPLTSTFDINAERAESSVQIDNAL